MCYTLLPLSGDPNVDQGPLSSFAATTLIVASNQGWGRDMVTRVKLPPCFGSSKQPRTELIEEPVLVRGSLLHNTHYVEHNGTTIMHSRTGQPLCQ